MDWTGLSVATGAVQYTAPGLQLVLPQNGQRLWLTMFTVNEPFSTAWLSSGSLAFIPPGTINQAQAWRMWNTGNFFSETWSYNDFGPMMQQPLYGSRGTNGEIRWVEATVNNPTFTSTRWGPCGCTVGYRMWNYSTDAGGDPILVLPADKNRVIFGSARNYDATGYYFTSQSGSAESKVARVPLSAKLAYRYADIGPIVHGPIYWAPEGGGAVAHSTYEVFTVGQI